MKHMRRRYTMHFLQNFVQHSSRGVTLNIEQKFKIEKGVWDNIRDYLRDCGLEDARIYKPDTYGIAQFIDMCHSVVTNDMCGPLFLDLSAVNLNGTFKARGIPIHVTFRDDGRIDNERCYVITMSVLAQNV